MYIYQIACWCWVTPWAMTRICACFWRWWVIHLHQWPNWQLRLSPHSAPSLAWLHAPGIWFVLGVGGLAGTSVVQISDLTTWREQECADPFWSSSLWGFPSPPVVLPLVLLGLLKGGVKSVNLRVKSVNLGFSVLFWEKVFISPVFSMSKNEWSEY